MIKRALSVFLVASSLAATAAAQTTGSPSLPKTPTEVAKTEAPGTAAPAPLVVYFDMGSSTLRSQDRAVLDHASRAYNEGKPIVMILTGAADRTGNAEANLDLSQRRAAAVLKGLLDRGIPANRFQVLAKGETDPTVPTEAGVPELQNRRVEITWR